MYSEGLLYAYSNTCTSLLRQKEKLQAPENQMLVTIDTPGLVRNLNLPFFFQRSDFI